MSERAMTLPQLFRDRVARHGDRVARRRKRSGQWIEETWSEWARAVDEVARGLISAGVRPREAVAIICQTRAEWVECDLGILSAGAVTIPIYPSSTPDQVAFILKDSEAVLAFCENEEQAAKVAAARATCPALRRIVTIEGKGAADGTLEELRREGWQVAQDDVRHRIEATLPDDVATIVYTSGTTGAPKGVVQSHANHYWMVANLAACGDMKDDDEDLMFLPLAHSYARCEEYGQIYTGFVTSYAESIEKMPANAAEVRPTLLFSVPRVYEKIYERVMAGAAAASPLKKRIFHFALGVGREASRVWQRGEELPLGLKLRYALADRLVFSKVRAVLGGRLRACVTGSAPIAREILEFFHGAGIPIFEGYGLTETCPGLTFNTSKAYRFGTVGRPIPGVELKIAPDGEILARGPNVARGYFKRDEDTKAVFLEGGWFATGDIGEIDAEGFLKITDRKKDLIKTSGGKYVAPQEVERVLKSDPLVAQAMVHGDRRKFCSAVLVLNRDAVLAWARDQGIEAATYEALVRHERLRALLAERLEALNRGLASHEQVKRFVISPREWTPESGELTPTLKVKRKVVTAQFEKELDALYDEKY